LSLHKDTDSLPGVLDSDYWGIINILLHNHSNSPIELHPDQAMAQILFLPLAQLPLVEVKELSKTS